MAQHAAPQPPVAERQGDEPREPSPPPIIEPPRRSPYSAKARIGRLIWGVVGATLWAWSPRFANPFRIALLRCFGATIGRGVVIDPSVRVEIPWNLTIGDHTRISRRAILYCLGPVTIGEGTLIGPHAHICAGTHDYTDPRFTLLRQPITIGSRCVIETAAFVAPNVTVGNGASLAPRASLYADAAPGVRYTGNPAKPASAGGSAG